MKPMTAPGWMGAGGSFTTGGGDTPGVPTTNTPALPSSTVGGMHWYMPDDDQVFGTASFDKQHVPGNGPLDDDTLQREQASYWMAHKIGLTRQNRRYYVYYVNGNRHGPMMEDAQVPGTEMIKEYWPNDSNGLLYKNHGWFEGDVAHAIRRLYELQPCPRGVPWALTPPRSTACPTNTSWRATAGCG